MPRGTQVRTPLQPPGIGRAMRGTSTSGGLCSKRMGDTGGLSLVFPKAQGGPKPGEQRLSPTFRSRGPHISHAVLALVLGALETKDVWGCCSLAPASWSHWKADVVGAVREQ